jgi:large-conductance mechanosensitive channel
MNQVNNLRKNVSDFINSQNIIGTISGVTIAISAGNTIRSFVNEIIFPTVYYLFRNKIKTSKFTPISYEHVSIFGKEFITFLFVLICTFYFVKIVMSNLFDIQSPTQTSNNKKGNTATVGANVETSDDSFQTYKS